MKKKGLYIIKIVLIIVVIFFQLHTISRVHATQKLRVGYIPVSDFIEQDALGNYSGYVYEYMQNIALYGGWDFEYIPGTWQECMQRLKEGTIDLLPGAILTANRQQDMIFSRLPISYTYMQLALRHGTQDLDQAATQKKTLQLGVIDKEYDTPYLARLAASENFAYQKEIFPSKKNMLDAFEQDRIDGFVTDMMNHASQPVAANFDIEPSYLVTQKENTDLMNAVDLAMEQLALANPQLQAYLFNKYYTKRERALTLSHTERTYLQQKGKLVLVTERGRPYYYWEDGVPQGIFSQFAKELSKDLGIEIEILSVATRAEALEKLASGAADFMPDIYTDYNWAEQQGLYLTAAYRQLSYAAVTRRLGNLPEHPRVACEKNQLYVEKHLVKLYSRDQLYYYDTAEACLEAVRKGEADLTYVCAEDTVYSIWKGKYYDLMSSSTGDFSYDISFGISKQADLRLLYILNKEIGHMDVEKNNQLTTTALFKMSNERSLLALVYDYPLHILVVCFFVAVLIIGWLLYWLRLRKQHVRHVQKLAYQDFATELPNLRCFERSVQMELQKKEIQQAIQEGRLAIVIFTIRRMHMLIEAYGRTPLLQALKNLVEKGICEKNWLRAVGVRSDVGQMITLYCSPNGKSVEKYVQHAIAAYNFANIEGQMVSLHLTAGIRYFPTTAISVRQLINDVDLVCREMDTSGENLRVFDNTLKNKIEREEKIERYMNMALIKKEFETWYQPKYDLRNHTCSGAEILVRWKNAEMGFLMPSNFIDIFERNGFILKLDFYMLHAACAMQRARLDAGLPIVPISVNQSRLHMSESDYLSKMHEIVLQYALPKGSIELEVTETAFVDMEQGKFRQETFQILAKLHKMGFSISMDDFGSGYSSLMLLNALPMDVMKIDRSLLDASIDSLRTQEILGHIIDLGKKLHMQVICEGIETKEQERLLLANECLYGQGYLYSKPLPLTEFEIFLQQHPLAEDMILR